MLVMFDIIVHVVSVLGNVMNCWRISMNSAGSIEELDSRLPLLSLMGDDIVV